MNICILIGTFRPDVAYKVMTEFTPQIIEYRAIGLRILADKLVAKKIINSTLRREVTDESTGRPHDERMRELLDIVTASIQGDRSIFGDFLKILSEEETRIAEKLCGDMERRLSNI